MLPPSVKQFIIEALFEITNVTFEMYNIQGGSRRDFLFYRVRQKKKKTKLNSG